MRRFLSIVIVFLMLLIAGCAKDEESSKVLELRKIQISEDAILTITASDRLEVVVEDSFDSFEKVMVDGKEVKNDLEHNYLLNNINDSGDVFSLILVNKYVKTLSAGEHILKIVTINGETEDIKFTISKDPKKVEAESSTGRVDESSNDNNDSSNGSNSIAYNSNTSSNNNSNSNGSSDTATTTVAATTTTTEAQTINVVVDWNTARCTTVQITSTYAEIPTEGDVKFYYTGQVIGDNDGECHVRIVSPSGKTTTDCVVFFGANGDTFMHDRYYEGFGEYGTYYVSFSD